MPSLQRTLISLFSFLTCFVSLKAEALEIIYDSHLNFYINEISKDLIANSKQKNVKIYIANSPEINAFATANNEIVLYSGLIEKSTNVGQLKGVLAHELGHLVGQHHVESRIESQNFSFPAIAGAILGGGALLAGAPQAGYAVIVGGGAASSSTALAHSRQHENEADSIALRLLKESNISENGLAEFFKILERQEKLFFKESPDFLNTHPSSLKRRSFIQANVSSLNKDIYDIDFEMFKARVFALTQEPDKVINTAKTKEDLRVKSFMLAIAYNTKGLFVESLKELDSARINSLKDIWYYDLLGQFEYANGEFNKSLKSYFKSKELGNDSWIVDFQIAESYFLLKDNNALDYYYKSLAKFKYFYQTYKRIADFYAQDGKMAKAHLNYANYYLKISDKENATRHIKLAQQFYKKEDVGDEEIKFQIDELASELIKKER